MFLGKKRKLAEASEDLLLTSAPEPYKIPKFDTTTPQEQQQLSTNTTVLESNFSQLEEEENVSASATACRRSQEEEPNDSQVFQVDTIGESMNEECMYAYQLNGIMHKLVPASYHYDSVLLVSRHEIQSRRPFCPLSHFDIDQMEDANEKAFYVAPVFVCRVKMNVHQLNELMAWCLSDLQKLDQLQLITSVVEEQDVQKNGIVMIPTCSQVIESMSHFGPVVAQFEEVSSIVKQTRNVKENRPVAELIEDLKNQHLSTKDCNIIDSFFGTLNKKSKTSKDKKKKAKGKREDILNRVPAQYRLFSNLFEDFVVINDDNQLFTISCLDGLFAPVYKKVISLGNLLVSRHSGRLLKYLTDERSQQERSITNSKENNRYRVYSIFSPVILSLFALCGEIATQLGKTDILLVDSTTLEEDLKIDEISACHKYLLSDLLVKYNGFNMSTSDLGTFGVFALKLAHAYTLFDNRLLKGKMYKSAYATTSTKAKTMVHSCKSIEDYEITISKSEDAHGVLFNLASIIYLELGMDSLLEFGRVVRPKGIPSYPKEKGYLHMLMESIPEDPSVTSKIDLIESAIGYSFQNRILAHNIFCNPKMENRVEFLGKVVCEFVAGLQGFQSHSLDLNEYIKQCTSSDNYQAADVKIPANTSTSGLFCKVVGAVILDSPSNVGTVSAFVNKFLLTKSLPESIATSNVLELVSKNKKKLGVDIRMNQTEINKLVDRLNHLKEEQEKMKATEQLYVGLTDKILQKYPILCPSSLYNNLQLNSHDTLFKEFGDDVIAAQKPVENSSNQSDCEKL